MAYTNAIVKSVNVNIAHRLKHTALRLPYKKAVVAPAGRDRRGRIAYTHLTFEQLDRESDNLARGLNQTGIGRGVKTVLMVKPGIDFFVLIFALFKVGAIPVVVDPGMGIARMLRCLESTAPEAFIGIPAAQAVRLVFPRFFRSIRVSVTAGPRLLGGGPTLDTLNRGPWQPYAPAKTERDESAAILLPPAVPDRPRGRFTPMATSTPKFSKSKIISPLRTTRSICQPFLCLPFSIRLWV